MHLQLSTPTLTLFESALFQTVTTCYSTPEYTLLVDPNWLPGEVESIAAHVDRVGAGKPLYLFFTHSDYDHIIAWERFPGAITLASEAFTGHPDPESVLQQIRDFDEDNYIVRPYPITYPLIRHPIAGDGTALLLGTDEWRFYQSPGHNRDGLIAFLPSQGMLIVGDYLSDVEFPFVEHSFADYRATLDKVDGLLQSGAVRILISGHGPHTRDPAAMQQRLRESRQYLADLERAVREGIDFDQAALFQRYAFPRSQRPYHLANVARVRSEMAEAD
ncbi:MBL fold metallo-hydrolase [Neolewinella lacunae]|uniref:MBL fold metallo-hydrolase n=1 Tax=Neolewinella lacunae TaxID=1517758 RepID=A0A923PFV3_9BACT|nr:MBL fold metallo-hydrolase [Neolewinella lacunae]MBC6993302.1 MBL fold metallo-hydrolase [Neolewinella lacunae]MDN3636857.1 MBL fold metallo-hydrolase [Neolewinella lacunae]